MIIELNKEYNLFLDPSPFYDLKQRPMLNEFRRKVSRAKYWSKGASKKNAVKRDTKIIVFQNTIYWFVSTIVYGWISLTYIQGIKMP